MRLTACLMLPLLLSGCGREVPPPASTSPPPAPPAPVSERVPADPVLQPQLQALDRARGVQDLADQAKERVDEATDEQRP